MIRISIFLLSLVVLAGCFKTEEADTILHNGTIYSIDELNTVYQAIAIKDGKIIALGAEREILNKYSAPQVIDVQKQFVYPGFIDGHAHFLGYGLNKQEADLVGTGSHQELLRRVKSYRDEHDNKNWIVGRGWDHTAFEEQSLPSRTLLDSVFPNTPVFLMRVDGHAALVNSKAIELAEISVKSTVEGGKYQLDDQGELTGILIDNAMNKVRALIPSPDEETIRQALQDAEKDCFAAGLTTVTDAGVHHEVVSLIENMHEQKTLKMRVYAMLSNKQENFDVFLSKGSLQTPRLTVSSFKFYGDGALGSRGACMLEPYSDSPQEQGFLMYDYAYYEEYAQKLFDAGFQMNTHCIGDSANRTILDIYADVLGGVNDRRWRIEHAQVVHPEDIHKFGDYGIIPSVQPTHATSDMRWAEDRLGKDRIQHAYAYRDLMDQLGILTLGTDFPVERIYPLETFYAAVARKDRSGNPENGFLPEQKLSRLAALKGMTIYAAIANFEEEKKGTLELGKYADMVVLDRDILKVAEDDILSTKIKMTIVDGEVVYRK